MKLKAAVCGYNTPNSGFVWREDFAGVIVQHSDVGGQGFSERDLREFLKGACYDEISTSGERLAIHAEGFSGFSRKWQGGLRYDPVPSNYYVTAPFHGANEGSNPASC
jgi:hypothetical protein